MAFAADAEAAAFGEVVRDAPEARIGAAITREVGEGAAEEFDLCPPEEQSTWLETHCPDFRELVRAAQETMFAELMAYRDRIPGVISAP